MAAGTQIHYGHGRTVLMAGCLRTLATIFLLGAVVLIVLHFAMQIM
jgi:hypothetical protein